MSEPRYGFTYHGDSRFDDICQRDAWLVLESTCRSTEIANAANRTGCPPIHETQLRLSQ